MSYNPRQCGTVKASSPNLTEVPGTPTDYIAEDATLFGIAVHNPTGGALTLIVTDKQSSPLQFIEVAIASNQTYLFEPRYPIPMKGGIVWGGSSTGLVGSVTATTGRPSN